MKKKKKWYFSFRQKTSTDIMDEGYTEPGWRCDQGLMAGYND